MASKTFNLGEGNDGGSGASCSKICVIICCVLLVGVVIVVAIFAYNSNAIGGTSGCGVPMLDENGLSNWTTGAETIAYACLPGYFLEGHSSVTVANCESDRWVPAPPACNYLPLRLDCEVKYKGLIGNVTMWQKAESDPTFIYGIVDYENVSRHDGHVLDIVYISKSSCQISDEVDSVHEMYLEADDSFRSGVIKVDFNTTEIKAFNKAEVHITLIFVDKVTTATLVSVHQGNLTLVMSSTIPTRKLEKKYLAELGYEFNEN